MRETERETEAENERETETVTETERLKVLFIQKHSRGLNLVSSRTYVHNRLL